LLLQPLACLTANISLSSRACRAIKFKEDLDPELKAQLERRPSEAQALLAPSEAPQPPPTFGSQQLTAVPRRRTAEVLVLLLWLFALASILLHSQQGGSLTLAPRLHPDRNISTRIALKPWNLRQTCAS